MGNKSWLKKSLKRYQIDVIANEITAQTMSKLQKKLNNPIYRMLLRFKIKLRKILNMK